MKFVMTGRTLGIFYMIREKWCAIRVIRGMLCLFIPEVWYLLGEYKLIKQKRRSQIHGDGKESLLTKNYVKNVHAASGTVGLYSWHSQVLKVREFNFVNWVGIQSMLELGITRWWAGYRLRPKNVLGRFSIYLVQHFLERMAHFTRL